MIYYIILNDKNPLIFELDMALLFQFMKILKKEWEKRFNKNGNRSIAN